MKRAPLKVLHRKQLIVETKLQQSKNWTNTAGALALRLDCCVPHISEETGEEMPTPSAPSDCTVYIPPPDERIERQLEIGTLSGEALFVVNLVLGAPSEIADLLCTPTTVRFSKRLIAHYLRTEEGWALGRVRETFAELARFVGQMGS